jgi:hypothetical protein
MVAAIRQQVTVQPGGVIEIRSPELEPGVRAEVIVLIGARPAPAAGAPDAAASPPPADPNGGDWRGFAGSLRSGTPGASDNDRIDADLAREHLDPHEPES